jgi:hypothetical protein
VGDGRCRELRVRLENISRGYTGGGWRVKRSLFTVVEIDAGVRTDLA